MVDSTVCYLHTMCADIHYSNNKQYALVILFFHYSIIIYHKYGMYHACIMH